LIVRRSDPNDARRAILSLTPKGRELNGRRARTVEASVRRALAAAPASRIDAASELLRALARELER
jgi:DNA-binding MarR family transcriptional regulator